jgi:hypothetical protein
MPSKSQVASEIKALKKLKPIGVWAHETQQLIDAAIDELLFPFDRTAAEWNELICSERVIREYVQLWKDTGQLKDQPSEMWKGLAI